MNFHQYKRKVEILARGSINTLIFKIKFNKGFNIDNTLVVCGAMRSGSTWLAEIISSLPGYAQIFEPLNSKYIKETKQSNIKVNMYLRKEEKWDSGIKLFNKILSGRLINTWTTSQIPIAKSVKTKNIVVKLVRGNMLLGWLSQHYQIKPPVLIIRHPCAIVSSILAKGWIPSPKVLLSHPYFNDKPELLEKCKKLPTPEERIALYWCLQYHAPLSLNPQPFILISYEKLVREGATELTRLFNIWELNITDEVISALLKPSHTITNKSNILIGKDPLTGWKDKLSTAQIKRVLAITKIFSMDFYTEKSEPDYKKLHNFSTMN